MLQKSSSSPVVYLGKHKNQNNSHLLVWQQPDFIKNLNSGKKIDEKLVNKIVKLLTGGKCIRYTKCYRGIEDYEKFISDKDMVFGITPNLKKDIRDIENQILKNVEKYILKNNWHFITDGEFFKSIDGTSIKRFADFFNIYGITVYFGNAKGFSLFYENICRDL